MRDIKFRRYLNHILKHKNQKGADNTRIGWHQEESRHHRIERRYWLTGAIMSFITTGAAIAAAIFAGYALKSSWDALGEAEKATGEAHRQADAAELGNRAWLAVDGATIDGTLEVGTDAFVKVTYQNVGREAAINVQADLKFDVIATTVDPAKEPINTGKQYYCNFININPGGTIAFPITGHEYNASHVLDKQFIRPDVLANKSALILRGCLSYTTLGKLHMTQVCIILAKGDWRVSPTSTTFCEDGNWAW